MRKYKDDVLKIRTIMTDRVAAQKIDSHYIDFYLCCDSAGMIYKVICNDYAVRFNYSKGVETFGHIPIDFDYDVINVIISKDKYEYKYKMHYLTFISLLEDLKLELKRNINMKAKVLEWANKGGFEAFYNIMNN